MKTVDDVRYTEYDNISVMAQKQRDVSFKKIVLLDFIGTID